MTHCIANYSLAESFYIVSPAGKTVCVTVSLERINKDKLPWTTSAEVLFLKIKFQVTFQSLMGGT